MLWKINTHPQPLLQSSGSRVVVDAPDCFTMHVLERCGTLLQIYYVHLAPTWPTRCVGELIAKQKAGKRSRNQNAGSDSGSRGSKPSCLL